MFHDACDDRQGRATAIVRETQDYNKMVYCFNCHGKIFVHETYWEDPILYSQNEIYTIDDKYITKIRDLPRLSARIYESQQKWIVIDAPTGSGKTWLIKEMLENNPSTKVLVIAKFTTLVRNLSAGFGLVCYKAGENVYNPPTDRYGCTLDHVCSLVNSSGSPRCNWDFIILDEAAMTRNHTTSSTIRDK